MGFFTLEFGPLQVYNVNEIFIGNFRSNLAQDVPCTTRLRTTNYGGGGILNGITLREPNLRRIINSLVCLV